MREIILDTETTGLDPASGHRIVEIGCVEVVSKMRTGKYFQAYINPERDMPEEARRVHGLDDKFLADKPVFASIVADFLDFIGDTPLVIHNAGFDMKFLNAELIRHGFPPLPMERAIDTVTLARRRFPGALVNLDALCKRYNIDLSGRSLHGALLDATLLADVYLELCGGSQASMAFDGSNNRETVEEAASTITPQAIPARDFPISEQELKAHNQFVETIKNALWESTHAKSEAGLEVK